MHRSDFTDRIKNRSRELGFRDVRICPAVAPDGLHRLWEWIDRGYAGEMAYLERRKEAYEHPRHVLPECRSVVALTVDYRSCDPFPPAPGQARVARYAWGSLDYHDWIRARLKQLQTSMLAWQPDSRTRGVVDTAPLLERDFARLAGLGWQAKNTMLISREAGSWFFLAFLLTDAELDYDDSFNDDYCGSCSACLDACPTGAFPEPYVLDASRCISYLTIEHRSQVPESLRQGIGDWLFGCDVCQEVCPWNRFSRTTEIADFVARAQNNPIDAIELLRLDDAQFRKRFRHTPLWRPHRRGILRNAAIVLGNQRATAAIPALIDALYDKESLVRGAAAWSLGRFEDNGSVRQALQTALQQESSEEVAREIRNALAQDVTIEDQE